MFLKTSALKNFANLSRKYLRCRPKKIPTQVFSCKIFKNTFFYRSILLIIGHTTLNQRRFDVDIASTLRRANFDEFSCDFHLRFWCNFADRKIHVVSKYFFRRNFDGRNIHVVSTYLFWRNFTGRNIHVFSTCLFWCNFYDRKIHVVSTYFFHVILMVERSMLFARTFVRKIVCKIWRHFRFNCKLMKTFEEVFPCQ